MSTKYRVCCCCYRSKSRPVPNDAPKGIKRIFAKYAEGGVMSAELLQRFLVEVQGEQNATVDTAEDLLEKLRREHLHLFHRKGAGITLDVFFRYIFSADHNPPLNPDLGVYQNMNLPLSQYFIYTGHNSYLTGNQLSSASSDVPVIKALQRGVRVVELDLWPTEDNDVKVTHGRTFSSPVELTKCLKSIKDHAFRASKYPVIVTLEDHLTPPLQAKVAKMIHETFGDVLFYPETEFLEEFPSPDQLKGRIMISTKPPKEFLEAKTFNEDGSDSQKGKETEAWGLELPDYKSLPNLKIHGTPHVQLEPDHIDNIQDEEVGLEGASKKQKMIAPEYKQLIAIAAKKKKGSLAETLKVEPGRVSRLSLNEQVLEMAAESHGTELVRFTQKNLLRIYPKGMRVTSTNYNPLLGWMHGVQLVALNMQGHGRPLWLMQGMFRANGGCGYVKKPDILLKVDANGHVFDPKARLRVKTTLKVKVYMGDGWCDDFSQSHFDSFSPPDFYTRVGIAGIPADTIMKATKPIEDNWTPVWEQEFKFPLRVPELALLRVEVHEYDMTDKDDFGGQTCLPVWELRSGIRCVPLHDHRGDRYKSVKLLMHFEFV